MNLEQLQQNWDKLGQEDAMWAILTDPNKKGRKWTAEEFFASGEQQIDSTLKSLADKGIRINFGTALDFGCGVGRLSQALARHFSEVHGVDIAPSMIEQARQFNRYPDKVTYHVNSSSDLKRFPDQKFDFICTYIVLQHIQGNFVLQYVREFVRTLRPGGVATFQFIEPSAFRRMIPAGLLDAYRKLRRGSQPFVWEFGVAHASVDKVIREAGGKILHSERAPRQLRAGFDYTYVVTK
jgi:2-polyprenyl-3-methyl-5-hydroxy-6-metoxy-1,4-benzoquinol methylase